MITRITCILLLYAIGACFISCRVEDSYEDQSTVINPYSDVDWAKIEYVPSCSHEHVTNQERVDLLEKIGVKHIAVSNYYPSKPYYPLKVFFEVPESIISSPNAEHHSMSPYGSLHINSLGSFFESGNPEGELPRGLGGERWENTFDTIFSQLQYYDGGGITINHPSWSMYAQEASNFSVVEICQMLDYDSRVLGIEFYNSTCEYGITEKMGWDLDTWDAILKTGRRCWGFCVADHRSSNNVGRLSGYNILLCDSIEEHECLKAYRDGQFYGSINNTSLRFNTISLSDRFLTVSAIEAETISIIINGEYHTIIGNDVSMLLPDNVLYVRIEAHNSTDSIYSNPILFN